MSRGVVQNGGSWQSERKGTLLHQKDHEIIYLLKETTTEDLRAAIRYAHQGMASLYPAIARRLLREFNRPTALASMYEPLTDREAEVLILIARGVAVAEIAGKLLMQEQTVYRHITSILTKIRQGPGPHHPLDPPLPLPIPVR